MGDILSYLNPFSDKFILKTVIQNLADLLSYINPFSDNFFLKIAFVPKTENLVFDDVRQTLYNKFSFIKSFEEIHDSFDEKFNQEENCPNFSITLPDFLGGATVNPINFSFFNQYRTFIHVFIIAVSYFVFIEKIYKLVPKILKGG